MGKSHLPDLGSKRSLLYNTHTQQQKGGLHLPLPRYEFVCPSKRIKALQHWTLITTEKYYSNFSSTINQNFFTIFLSDDVTDIWDELP